jgi:hypothetical protein
MTVSVFTKIVLLFFMSYIYDINLETSVHSMGSSDDIRGCIAQVSVTHAQYMWMSSCRSTRVWCRQNFIPPLFVFQQFKLLCFQNMPLAIVAIALRASPTNVLNKIVF